MKELLVETPSFNMMERIEKELIKAPPPGSTVEIGYEKNTYHEIAKNDDNHNVYCRQYFLKKNNVVISRMHKTNHFFVLLFGDITIWTYDNVYRVRPPYMTKTTSGTKRIIRAHADSLMATFQSVDIEGDTLEEQVHNIEDKVIVPTEEERQYLLSVETPMKIEEKNPYMKRLSAWLKLLD